MRLPEWFPDKELSCRCGCGLMPPAASVHRLYALRVIWGRPMVLTSAARCPEHNRRVGGKPGSTHLPADKRVGVSLTWGGQGFDVRCPEDDHRKLMAAAIMCGFTGFGFGSDFLHADDADRPAIATWRY